MWFRLLVWLIVTTIVLMLVLFRYDSVIYSIFDPTILKSGSTQSLSIMPEVKISFFVECAYYGYWCFLCN